MPKITRKAAALHDAGIPPMVAQPGWIVEKVLVPSTGGIDTNKPAMPTFCAPSLEQLRAKFTKSEDGGIDAPAPAVDYGKTAKDIEVVLVKPEGGGASKIAYRDRAGNIEIMQG